MQIAIVDSGVDVGHKRLKNCACSGVSLWFDGENERLTITDEYGDSLGHGTACASIVHKVEPRVEIVAVKIFHSELSAKEGLLCEGIRWCLDNDIDIINLSLGIQTDSPSQELLGLLEEAFEKNVAVVSAAHNDLRLECYPAHFHTVFGVTWGKVDHHRLYGYLPDSPIEFIAKGTIQRVAWKDGGYSLMSGTSMACAYFTGITAGVFRQSPSMLIGELRSHLIENADANIRQLQLGGNIQGAFPRIISGDLDEAGRRLFRRAEKMDWLGNLAVFPASEKEMSGFVEFPGYCTQKIVKYIDYPRNMKMPHQNGRGKSASIKIYDKMLDAADCGDFDTMVLGYFYDQLFEANIRFGNDLLDVCMKAQKNLYIYDPRLKSHIECLNGDAGPLFRMYMPEVSSRLHDRVMQFRHLPKVRVPVMAVMGTSNRQGKFTAQLRLKDILKREGYAVNHISTEPQGELFGADFSFPYGYNGTVSIGREEWSMFLRILLKGVQEYNDPHIILTGTQGMTVPRVRNQAPLGNECDGLEFMFGVQPDALICAINPQDPIELVVNACQATRIFCGAEPLFFIMTPWMRDHTRSGNGRIVSRHRYLNKDEMKEKMDHFEEGLQKPVIDIMDENNDGLILEAIQDFFS